ncbi:MAG: hypothetical protein E7001_03250 [Coriobacteriaceae bacterium]|nr:hypothetical protein [Coriobacteriaceae bacterium]
MRRYVEYNERLGTYRRVFEDEGPTGVFTTPILDQFDAADCGAVEDMERLYQGDPNARNRFTLLGHCAGSRRDPEGRLDVARWLLDHGADPNGRSERGMTPLHLLLFDMFPRPVPYLVAMTDLLLGAGADASAEDNYKETPLGYAVRNTKGRTEELRPIYLALLRLGADPRHVNTFGRTPLDYARELSFRRGFVDIVEEFERSRA